MSTLLKTGKGRQSKDQRESVEALRMLAGANSVHVYLRATNEPLKLELLGGDGMMHKWTVDPDGAAHRAV
jgi:hypothetical protein